MRELGKKIIWQRASEYIKRYHPLLIGIAGSTGKTITKDALACAIGSDRHIRFAPYSYNTPIGVALSILGLEVKDVARHWAKLLINSKVKELTGSEPELIILELGADRPGDIDYLANRLPFTIGIVTNAQSTHLRLFQDKAMVAHEMTSLIVKLPPATGRAILFTDDPLVKAMSKHSRAPVTFFGSNPSAAVRLLRATRTDRLGFACELSAGGKIHELHLRHVIARHHLPHVLAAVAVLPDLKVNLPPAIVRLQKFVPPPGRMRILTGIHKSVVIDDTYNAPPESVLAALDTLTDLPGTRRIIVLGDMLDLGGGTVAWHEKVGKAAAEIADLLITVGDNMRRAGAAALKSASDKEKKLDVHHFESSRDVGKWLTQYIQPDDLVLVKGSRDMHMEEVVKRLLAHPNEDSHHVLGG